MAPSLTGLGSSPADKICAQANVIATAILQPREPDAGKQAGMIKLRSGSTPPDADQALRLAICASSFFLEGPYRLMMVAASLGGMPYFFAKAATS